MSTISSTSRASHYRVYLHLDTNGGWVNGGGAITPRMAARFSCDGTVTPLWETEGRPVSVGRDRRILPARTRRLIEDRDRGCRIPGCSATRFVEIHHLDHWADGGATDYDTQVSLCPFHHDAHHRGDITVTGDPTRPDGLTVTNRHGLPIRPPTPPTGPVRSVGDPTNLTQRMLALPQLILPDPGRTPAPRRTHASPRHRVRTRRVADLAPSHT